MFIIGINSGNLGEISVLSLVFLGFNIFATVVLALLNMMDLFVKTAIVNNGVLKNASEMPPKDDVETDLEVLFGRRMDGEEIAAFRNALERRGIRATVRRTRGLDVQGACGQLRSSERLKEARVATVPSAN